MLPLQPKDSHGITRKPIAKRDKAQDGSAQTLPAESSAQGFRREAKAKAGQASPLTSPSFEDIPLEGMSRSTRGRRREHPVDASIAAITTPATPRSASPGSRRSSTDSWGMPRPATQGPTGKNWREELRREEAAGFKNYRKIGIAAGAATLLGTAAAITVSTIKNVKGSL